MKNNPYEKSDMWRTLISALLKYVVGQTTKIDRKGREFISFSFMKNTMGVKSLVVYMTPKGDIRILATVTMTSKRGDKFNKSFCYLLKNINEQEFFLICGKERLANHSKKRIMDIIEGRAKSGDQIYDEVEKEGYISDGWVDHSDGDNDPF
jgi:hypothetical protein